MIKKLFGPINRWQFTIAYLLLSVVYALIGRFTLFFYPITGTEILLESILWFIVLNIILAYKRFFDVFDSWWKALLCSLLVLASMCAIIINTSIILKTQVDNIITPNNTENLKSQIILQGIITLFVIFLTLFLLFKKGKNNTKPFEWKVTLRRTIIVILIVLTVNVIQYRTGFAINHGMMYPTIEVEPSLVSKIVKNVKLSRGDIVADKNDYRLRRIIGLPNETVEMRGKEIYINGKLFDDKYAFYSEKLEPIHFQKTFKLDNNQYLLIGDNRYFTEGGKILGKNKEGVESWRPLREKSVYMVVPKENLVEKVVGIHYLGYDRETKKWKSAGFAFAFNGKPFEHNFKRRSIYDKMFLKD